MKKVSIILTMLIAGSIAINAQAFEKPVKYNEEPIILDRQIIYEKNDKTFLLDKETLAIIDVNKDSLRVIVHVLEMKSEKIIKEKPMEFLIPTEGDPSVKIKNKWVKIIEEDGKKFEKAIEIIKNELGEKNKREKFLKQIEYIVKHKKEIEKERNEEKLKNKEKNETETSGVKIHGQVLTDKELQKMKEKEKKEDEFIITITETPTVEIVSHDDVQVEITTQP